MNSRFYVNRRDFLLTSSVVGAGLVLGTPMAWAQESYQSGQPERPKTNIDEAMLVERTEFSLPGKFPGRTVEVHGEASMRDGKPVAAEVEKMFTAGIEKLTDKSAADSYAMLMTPDDIVGIKVKPIGAGLIATRHEVVAAIIAWLEASGHPRKNIVIWDRFDYMLPDAGFTPDRYPGIAIEGLQTMDEAAAAGQTEDDSGWLDEYGVHRSRKQFDDNVYYWADVDAPQDKTYLNQHVTNDKNSYFGKLLTQKLTKIINMPVLKNTGNGISVATKNLGYGAICNTGRLHRPLFFDVCTEVLAFPCIRDKLVLNVADALRGQYDGGPMPAADFAFEHKRLFMATDPFALDMVCHNELVRVRKAKGIDVNEHPRYTEYLRYAERLGIGIVDPNKTTHETVELS
ncbi:DUF362 domain-containing protein [candidate division GN15 bacterium]|nr:DUF362 domain-containing protein [candidate division GN15 bacterium]